MFKAILKEGDNWFDGVLWPDEVIRFGWFASIKDIDKANDYFLSLNWDWHHKSDYFWEFVEQGELPAGSTVETSATWTE